MLDNNSGENVGDRAGCEVVAVDEQQWARMVSIGVPSDKVELSDLLRSLVPTSQKLVCRSLGSWRFQLFRTLCKN